MLFVRNAELIITSLTFLIAYIASATLAGSFRAWVAKSVGDDTGELLGFLTLNPLMHIDMIGIVFLLFFYFGWGRFVPINPHNISQPHRYLKLVAAYFSDSFAYIASALVGIILLIIMAGPQMMLVAQFMLMENMSHAYLVYMCPNLSSFIITLSFIVLAFVYLNVILGIINLILNSFGLLVYLLTERSNRDQEHNFYLIMLVPIIVVLLFSEPLRRLVIRLITIVGYSISHILGLI